MKELLPVEDWKLEVRFQRDPNDDSNMRLVLSAMIWRDTGWDVGTNIWFSDFSPTVTNTQQLAIFANSQVAAQKSIEAAINAEAAASPALAETP